MPEAKVQEDQNKTFVKLTFKEFFDKIGFGFSSQQFINILFFQISGSYFLLGLVNGLRVVFGNLAYFLIGNYKNALNRKFISLSGIIFGFSFLLMAVAIYLKSIVLFSLAMVTGSIFVIFYGESKGLFVLSSSKAYLIEKIVKYGLIVTAISLFAAAYILDNFPSAGFPILLNFSNYLFQQKYMGT